MDRPYFVIVDEPTVCVDRTIRKAVRPLIQFSIWLDEAAVVNLLAIRVGDYKLYPGFIQVTHLWNQRMPDVLVLNDRHRLHHFTRCKSERSRTQRCDQLVVVRLANCE